MQPRDLRNAPSACRVRLGRVRGRPPNKNITATSGRIHKIIPVASGRPNKKYSSSKRTATRAAPCTRQNLAKIISSVGRKQYEYVLHPPSNDKQPVGLPTTAGCGPRGRPPNKNITATNGRIHKIITVASGRSHKKYYSSKRTAPNPT